jgi:hypothetical protein
VLGGKTMLVHQMEVGPLVGSGVLSYTLPVASARTESGQEAAPAAIGSYSKYIDVAHPATGNLIEGWKWDQRVWAEDSTENSAVYLPTNWDPTTSGISESYFQSGIGSHDDLKLQNILEIPSENINSLDAFNIWAPVINHGYYYDYEEQDYLFSDDSELLYATYSGVAYDGFNEIELSQRTKVGIPVRVRQLKWDNEEGKYNVAKTLRKKIQFTGIRDSSNARVSTYNEDSESILFENVDQSFDEFVIVTSGEQTKIILSNQYSEPVGSGIVPNDLEFCGYADGSSSQQFHTQFAPVDYGMSVEVYSYLTTSGPVTQWTVIDFDQTLVGNQVKFDYDLGILEFGDPEQGQTIPAAGHTIGVKYYKTVYAEYEPDYTQNTVTAIEANVNPIYRRNSRGFLYLATALEDPAVVDLRAALPELQSNQFGPLNIGSSFAPIIATVKDSKGQELEGQVVDFYITSVPAAGSFGVALADKTTSSFTDENGEARVFYIPPRGINDIGESIQAENWTEVTNTVGTEYEAYSEVTKLTTTNLLIQGNLQDVFLYEVYIDDPILGLRDVTLGTNNSAVQVANYYNEFFTENEITGGTKDAEWEDAHRETWDLVKPLIFSENLGLGRKKIVATVDSTAINPYTFEEGAVSPVQPINIENLGGGQYNVVFDTSTFDIPEPSASLPSPTGTLHSYFVVAPTEVKLQAEVFNERRNKYIKSNEISIKLSIPSYLSGLWIVDSINQNHIDEISPLLANITASGQRVPLGFRLRSSRITLAAALDGVTFLDVNRPWNYDPYDPDTVSGVRLGHQINVSGVS